MANESRERDPATAYRESAGDGELPSRGDLQAAVTLKREEIARGLNALQDEIRHIPIRAFIQEHPVKTTAGAALMGASLGRWLVSRLGSREPTPEEYRRELLDELIELVVDDAAHAVATGASRQEAIRSAVRAHSPIVFEVEREPEEEVESVAVTLMHTLFALLQPYLQQYLRARLKALQPKSGT